MKKVFLPLFGIMIFALTLFSITPPVAAETDARLEAHRAYYEYLTAEIEGIGGPVRDEDYYNMFTDKVQRPAILEKILAVYLVDVTNDGIEELIIKRQVTHEYSNPLDNDLMDWICIYSFVDGNLTRIGQNRKWRKSVGENKWTDYEPDGFIGNILSSAQVSSTYSDEYVTLCWSEDGKVFLCDKEIVTQTEGYFSMYSFNGTRMERTAHFSIRFIPDWVIGSIHSQYGEYRHDIDDTEVSPSEYKSRLNSYTERGTYQLVNNDYHEVLNILSTTIQGQDVPYGDANPHCHIPTEWIVEGGQHYRTCQSGCDVKLNVGACEGGTPTCFQKAICEICGQPYGELTEHVPSNRYSSENGQHFLPCLTEGCTEVFETGSCKDANKDHKCDICKAEVGVHEAAEGTHICDYCGSRATSCSDFDENKDHVCDICGGEVRVHAAYDHEHICRYCGQPASDCKDANNDGKCDICKEAMPESNGGSGCSGSVTGTSAAGAALLCLGVWLVRKKEDSLS